MAMRIDRDLFSPLKTLADQFRKLQTAPLYPDAYCPYITTPEEVKIEEEKAQRVGSKVRRKAVFGAQLLGVCAPRNSPTTARSGACCAPKLTSIRFHLPRANERTLIFDGHL